MRYQGGKTRIAAQIAPFIIAEGGGNALLACSAVRAPSKAVLHRTLSALS